ncbi:MAG: transcriptional repressor [Anaerolineae bacterium]|nr:transcriptional repressor [Anaerolineae bacterium]
MQKFKTMIDLDTLLADLRRRNPSARITAQRRLVLEALLSDIKGHHTCEDVTRMVQARGVTLDQSTVYRILQWLKAYGVVSQTDLGMGSDVYCLVAGEPHHHLICLACGAIIDVDDTIFASLRRTLKLAYRFDPRIEHFAIFGTCEKCKPHDDEDEHLNDMS